MLPTEGRNPEVIGGNRLSGLSQRNVDGCMVVRGLLGDVQHCALGDQTVQQRRYLALWWDWAMP
jgi:hypothetical protein